MKKLLAFAITALFAVSLSAGEYPDISIKELKTHIAKKKVTVIDVMGGSSFKRGHVPTAISFAQHGKNLAKVLPADKNIFARATALSRAWKLPGASQLSGRCAPPAPAHVAARGLAR